MEEGDGLHVVRQQLQQPEGELPQDIREKEPHATSTKGVLSGCVCLRFNLCVGKMYGACAPSRIGVSMGLVGVCVPESMVPAVILGKWLAMGRGV